MAVLTADQILAAQDDRLEKVAVPEWGGEVCVRNLSGTERNEFEAGLVDSKGKVTLANISARLLSLALCDEQRKPLFTKGDVARLGKKNAAALGRLFERAKELSGISKEDVEEYAGNSEDGQS